MNRAALIALGALFIALPGLFTSCPMEMETGPVVQSDFYGIWASPIDETTGSGTVYTISADRFKAAYPGSFQAPHDLAISRWEPRRNTYVNEIGNAYFSGFKITAGSMYYILYMHANKQTLIKYQNGASEDDPDNYIVLNKRAPLGDDGVQKRITITGIPAASFTGGQRGAQIEVKNYLNETVAGVRTTQHALDNTMTFELRKPGDGSYNGAEWTETGGEYTIRFLILAARYGSITSPMQQFHFVKYDAAFSGAELVIPFERGHWDFWDPVLP